MANRKPNPTEQDAAHFQSRRAAIQSLGLVPFLAVVGCGSDEHAASGTRNDDGGNVTGRKEDAAGRPAPHKDAGPPPHPYVALFDEFVEVFNAHELDRTLAFFSDDATVRVNGRVLDGHDAIRAFLAEYGATHEGTALTSADLTYDKALVADDKIAVIGGRLIGTPQAPISGFTSSAFYVQMSMGGMFQIDGDSSHFASCDIILNWGALLPTPI